MKGNEVILEGKNVGTERVHNMDFTVLKGQIVTIIGPSGSGKSTLINLLNRINDPLEGEILFHGKNVKEYPVPELRKKIGMVFQTANLFTGTVEENLKYGPEIWGEWTPELGKELLRFVQLPEEFLSKDVEDISGGQQQRVSFARTLANDPEVLLMDEATSALDNRTEELVEEELLQLVKEKKITILMITHDLEQARRLGDQTFFIADGRILEQGKTEDLFESPATEELKFFLEVE
ncbi:phosphate ABC transporter ATP-binding protein [Pseudalkalibacillus caeni]|uniref:Phosphate ABC transporter ATP-binding protein n=1 Tax=Exobacillus caeni TaxID=2574798 RepID=A0A5R9EX03_9BACL|nr:phosphate ABC transporter ATP-binding protein [Pseudalkalibacillus caeni]TLS35391.1 phosphate ABC transporter ATP-binding protein [Pseudalkalibacillus caeni]